MLKNKRKCYCQAKLRDDGTCPHGCDPALRKPSQRAKREEKKLRRREEIAASKGSSWWK